MSDTWRRRSHLLNADLSSLFPIWDWLCEERNATKVSNLHMRLETLVVDNIGSSTRSKENQKTGRTKNRNTSDNFRAHFEHIQDASIARMHTRFYDNGSH